MSQHRRASLGPDFGYQPGEQPPPGDGWLKLNTNEAPLPPSPRVTEAIAAAAAGLRSYPDPLGEPLRSALARHHGVRPDQVFVANGADEVIDCCFRAFCDPGDMAAWASPTYSYFPVRAALYGVRWSALPLEADLTLPQSLGTVPARLRFVVNPNSPTGVWMQPDTLEELLDGAEGVVSIDEAYCDFAPASCVPLIERHPNWLVLRTFSKAHALAGLRVGYAIGASALIADLYAVKHSYPVDHCAIAGALAALEDGRHHQAIVDLVIRERGRLTERLRQAGWEVPASHANFLFARPPGGNAGAVQARLRDARILVRRFEGDHPDRLRISVGAEAENDRLLGSLGS